METKTKLTSHKQCLFGFLLHKYPKKTNTDQRILQVFLICLKRNEPQNFKFGNHKKLFLQCQTPRNQGGRGAGRLQLPPLPLRLLLKLTFYNDLSKIDNDNEKIYQDHYHFEK